MHMNKHLITEQHTLTRPHTHPLLAENMSKKVISWLPSFPREYVIVCIGTDRSTGDALGPLVGTCLSNGGPKHMTVYGTLHQPVHAQNLECYIQKIHAKHRNPYVIAIDACLGKSSSIGNVSVGKGPLRPGAALRKDLPMIGDIHITGVVNMSGFMEYTILQNTRLSIVVDMAKSISDILVMLDQQLSFQHTQPAIVSPKYGQASI